MADGVTTQSGTLATLSSGTVLATDDTGATGHVGIVKLGVSANGDITFAPVTATDGVLVNLGTNNDVTVTSGNITADTELPAAASLTDNFANPTAPGVGAFHMVWDGATWDRAPGTSANGQLVDLGANNDVTVTSGAITETNSGSILTSVQLIDDIVYTDDTSTHSTGSSKGALFMAAAAPTDASVNANDIGAVAMTTDRKLHVSVQDSLPAGTNAIGKLAANSGIDIGDVDVTSVIPGTGATNLGKAESASHTSGDVGVMPLGVRNDAGTALATDGQYIPLSMDASGAVRVTGGGGGTQYTEDAVAAADPVGTALILVRKDTPATTVTTDGDNIAQRGSNYGAAYVTLVDSSGGFVSVGGGTQYDEDTVSAAADKLTMAGVVRKDTAATLVDTDGDRTQLQVTAAGRLWTSAVLDTALPAGTNNIGDVDVLTLPAVTNAGTFAVQDSQVTTDNGSFTDGTTKLFTAGFIFDEVAGTALTENDAAAARVTSNRAQVGVIEDGSTRARYATVTASNALKVDGSAVTQPVSGTITETNSANALTALQLIDDTVFTDDAGFTVGTHKVNAVGFLADESSTDSVDENDIGIARMTLDRKIIVTVEPHTAGGWDVKNCSSSDGATALTSTAQAVKASAGKLGGYYIYNPNATAQFVQVWDLGTGSITVGTTNPLLMFTIPATSAANLELVNGITCGTAISVAATSTAGGNGAPGTALDAIFFYK